MIANPVYTYCLGQKGHYLHLFRNGPDLILPTIADSLKLCYCSKKRQIFLLVHESRNFHFELNFVQNKMILLKKWPCLFSPIYSFITWVCFSGMFDSDNKLKRFEIRESVFRETIYLAWSSCWTVYNLFGFLLKLDFLSSRSFICI